MGNIISYLIWRGDLPFRLYPFNDVDNLILCELVYTDFNGIVPLKKENGSILLRDACERKLESAGKRNELLTALISSSRFKDARLSNYQDILDIQKGGTQFAAMTIELLDEGTIIVFRGTDLSIIGWREDFEIGCRITSAQSLAVEYVNHVIEENQGMFRVAGHSKGGNLAIYSAMKCKSEYQNRIAAIYSNDGPGLCPEFMDYEAFENIRDRIHKIVPEFSVIGALFEENIPITIVKSNGIGILQHATLNWQVEGEVFLKVPERDKEAAFYNELFDQWMEAIPVNERQIFVDDFFNSLSAGGAQQMDELTKGGIPAWEKILLSMENADHQSRKVFARFVKTAVVNMKAISFREVIKDRKSIPWIAAFVLGLFFLTFPLYSRQILGSVFFALLFVYSVCKIWKCEKQRGKKSRFSRKEILFCVIAILEIVCVVFNQIAVLSTNLALGIFFLFRAYLQGKKVLEAKKKKNRFISVVYVLDSIMAVGLGIFSLVTFQKAEGELILVVGAYMILIGIVELLKIGIEKEGVRK